MTSPLMTLAEVSKTYRMGDVLVRALDHVSLEIQPGEFIAIMGPSGSGKSTLMNVLGLLDSPDEGTYRLLGEEVSKLTEDALAARRCRDIGFVFQQFNLLPRTSAEENVALPGLYRDGRADLLRADDLLAQVGLGDRRSHHPSELSGGQQQRVAIARALMNRPSILFADEPTGNLDSVSQTEIMGLISSLNADGITVIIVTHETEIAAYTRRIIRMRDGKVQSDERRMPEVGSKKQTTETGKSTKEHSFSRALRLSAAHVTQAARSLAANKVRAFLSMLGILIGVASVIAMMALGTGAQDSIAKQLSSLGSNLLIVMPGGARSGGVMLGAGTVSRLVLEDAEEIRAKIPGVKFISPSVSGRVQATFGDKNWNSRVSGTGSDYAVMRAATPVVGRFFTPEEVALRSRVVVLGASVANALMGDRNPVGETIRLNRINFLVIGLLPVKGAAGFMDQDDIVIIPVTTAMRRLLGKTYVDSIDVEVKDSASIPTVQRALIETVNARHHVRDFDGEEYQVRNMADLQEAMSSTSRILSMLLAFIASISLVVGGIGIMNIMLVSVTERTREIGLRKALGATRRSIATQFLVEAGMVSVGGGGLGILLGIGSSMALASVTDWSLRIAGDSVLIAVAFSVIVGLLFGFWPARKASALHPIEALRHE